MKPDVKVLVDELEKALNDSVAESDRVATIVADLKRAGYDLMMLLEVTMRLTPAEAPVATEVQPAPERESGSSGKLELTLEDLEFLQGLKVGVGE